MSLNTGDASNAALPSTHPVVLSIPPLPHSVRGERTNLSGKLSGRLWSHLPVVIYPSNKQIVCRTLSIVPSKTLSQESEASALSSLSHSPPPLLPEIHKTLSSLVYRSHATTVTSVSVAPSGCYVASGDNKGTLKVWALDHAEHRAKYQTSSLLTGPILHCDWDEASQKVLVVGERSPTDTSANSACAKVITYDTGVTNGTLSLHTKGRATGGALKPTRPYRIVTSGRDDAKLLWHSGPPFVKLVPKKDKDKANATVTLPPPPTETAHAAGSVVHAVQYTKNGDYAVSVGSDKALCLYHGTTGVLLTKVTAAHTATIYSVAAAAAAVDNNNDTTGNFLLTASGDGTAKLWSIVVTTSSSSSSTDQETVSVTPMAVWNVAAHQANSNSNATSTKVPLGSVLTAATFCHNGTIPVVTSFNGQLHILHGHDMEHCSTTTTSSSSNQDKSKLWCQTITGHVAPLATCSMWPWSRLGVHDVVYFYTGDTNGVVVQWTWNPTTCACTPVSRLEPIHDADGLHVLHSGAICGSALVVNGSTDSKQQRLWTVGWDDVLHTAVANKDDDVKAAMAVVVQPNPAPLGAQPVTMAAGTHTACIVTVQGLLLVSTKNAASAAASARPSPMIAIPYEAQAVVVADNDCTVYVGGKDCKIYVYDIDNNALTLTLKHTIDNGHLKPIHSLALSPDGTKLASADERDVCVWDLTANYSPLVGRGKWCFHVQRVTALAWYPSVDKNDCILVSGGADDSIYVWSLDKKMTRLHYPYAHRGGIVSLHFLPNVTNQMMLLSTGVDSVVNVWDITANVRAKFG
jgi:WD repeat-containing protein 1 (actin-interacting protein 1)